MLRKSLNPMNTETARASRGFVSVEGRSGKSGIKGFGSRFGFKAYRWEV